jgi:hypothetical protein
VPVIVELPADADAQAGIADVIVGAQDRRFRIQLAEAVTHARTQPQGIDALVLEVDRAPVGEGEQPPAVIRTGVSTSTP